MPKSEHGHAAFTPWDALHHKAGAYDGGKCLGRHEAYYYENNSCSYRWQAVKQATNDQAIYDAHSDPTKRMAGTAWRTPADSTAQKYNAGGALVSMGPAFDPSPPTGNKGKKRQKRDKVRLVLAKAFRTGFAPYDNQAHHLLPDATLREGVFEVTEGATNVRDAILQGLLSEAYNMNHWKNMMILPCARSHGKEIGLPTHPNGHNHPTYSAEIKAKVKKALRPYQAAVDDEKQGKPHVVPDPKKVKDDLEAISVGLHALILSKVATLKASTTEVQVNDFHPDVASATTF